MIIVLEGVDGVGKTTVARIMNDKIPLSNMLKLSGAPKNVTDPAWMSEIYYSLFPFLVEQGSKSNLILDRGWVSELVYMPIFRGPDYNVDYLRPFMKMLHRNVDVTYFYLTANFKIIASRIEKKKKQQPNEKHMDLYTAERIVKGYNNWFQSPAEGERKVHVATDGLTPDEIADLIIGECGIELSKPDDTYHTVGGGK